jgi:hypothetical protein
VGKICIFNKSQSIMNARKYRVRINLSPVDFPAITGLGESTVAYQSEPHIVDNMVELNIIKAYILIDDNNKQHNVLSVQSIYQIPCNEINSREDVGAFYNDALQGLNEAYQFARTQMPTLFNITFPEQPTERYKPEIDRVFNLLDRRN